MMKKKIVTMTVAVMVILMYATTIVQAVPLKEINNDKFQAYYDQGTYSLLAYATTVVRTYVPSFDQVNKLVADVDEQFINYAITVGGHTYTLGKDFDYSGHVTQTYFDPVFTNDAKLVVASSRSSMIMVKYTFDFSAYPGSIEGTLSMSAVFAQGNDKIHSLSGTGDLQNVQISAVNLTPTVNLPLITAKHAGTVMGWPDIAPLP